MRRRGCVITDLHLEGSIRGPTGRPRHGVLLQGLRLCQTDPLSAPVHDSVQGCSASNARKPAYGTQGDAIERLTQTCVEKRNMAPCVAEARRELGQRGVSEYAKQWRPRQLRMTEYSTGEHVDSSAANPVPLENTIRAVACSFVDPGDAASSVLGRSADVAVGRRCTGPESDHGARCRSAQPRLRGHPHHSACPAPSTPGPQTDVHPARRSGRPSTTPIVNSASCA